MTDQVETRTHELDTEALDRAVGGVTPTETEMLACRKAGGSSQPLIPAVQSSIIAV